MKQVVALPSNAPGGLDAELAGHFGHCFAFTLVSVEDGRIGEIKVAPAVPHEQGGCMAPVNFLASLGVQTLIAGGMGMRPLMGFQQVGIDVFHHDGLQKVGDAVQAYVEGRLPRFGSNMTCGGGGGAL